MSSLRPSARRSPNRWTPSARNAASPNALTSANSSFAIASGGPSERDCEATVKCVASFATASSPRSIVNCHLYPAQPRMPMVAAKAFNVSHLSAFCAEKRTGPAEFSHDLLSRMIGVASPGQIVDAATLRVAATSSAFAADWNRIIFMALAHTARAVSARQRKDVALLRVAPPEIPRSAQSARSRRAHGEGAAPVTASTKGSLRSGLSSASSMSSPRHLYPALSSAAVGPADGGDEFRDKDGRRRLFLPSVDHPSWSQHAEGFHDSFDKARCDATGRSLMDAQQQLVEYENSRFANSGTYRQVYDCGRSLELGKTHKNVARGATVVDLSRLVNTSFNPYFSEKTVANEKLPLSSAMISRSAVVPPSLRKTMESEGSTAKRVNESIAAVVEYLDTIA